MYKLPSILILLLIMKILFQNFRTTMYQHIGQNKRRKYKASEQSVA